MTVATSHAGRSPFGAGFLLAQLGAHAAARYAARVAPLGLTPPHVGLLRAIAVEPARSQQALADEFGMLASRIVVLLDDLEERGLVERRRDTRDRRVHVVSITAAGKAMMTKLGQLNRQAEVSLLAALDAAERDQLHQLLLRVADEQGLSRGVHPGYRTLRPGTEDRGCPPQR